MAFKLSCVSEILHKLVFPNLLKKRNQIAIALILIPEYGQSNPTLHYVERVKKIKIKIAQSARSGVCVSHV